MESTPSTQEGEQQDQNNSTIYTPSDEELKQLVDFLDPLKNDPTSSDRFNALTNLTQVELSNQIRKLEEWALVLGVNEDIQLQKGKLLGILNDH
ncbi:hypothetical protein SAMD00019534_091480 [Acytostelium subglobosum LB1]|uniref:hypothetical protein n=1 Tax=Acytostelium subglobosum LB1 TaxID=1410327 RepID=UPI0006450EBB|nr:hypothetical protein SAMD00019534_091480 [Acytostelium subglobosum LB1]GAM25973.1 hypothetical protein SAMD00019534_091480 [Acytostelium subglobosum LB1]|eukprot:XP_012751016.1 hypothetical protein SAMD00019534_091480 [Acytostelium subglobosum LB1]